MFEFMAQFLFLCPFTTLVFLLFVIWHHLTSQQDNTYDVRETMGICYKAIGMCLYMATCFLMLCLYLLGLATTAKVILILLLVQIFTAAYATFIRKG
jgi:hypothetical protein